MGMNQELIDMAKAAATANGLDPSLICAIIEQESGWNTWAIRFEPAFYSKYVPRNLNPTEATSRAFSWGLMQIMGEVAREEGFSGFLPSLCDPTIGLAAGIKHFKTRMALAHGNVSGALQFWNGGGNPNYAAEVLARLGTYSGNV